MKAGTRTDVLGYLGPTHSYAPECQDGLKFDGVLMPVYTILSVLPVVWASRMVGNHYHIRIAALMDVRLG